jgi:hypothetical protein
VELLWEQLTANEMPAFLTLGAYQVLVCRT